MCGGKADGGGAPQPVQLSNLEPSSRSRPPPGVDTRPPPTSRREHRPSSSTAHKRPQSERHHRPSSSSASTRPSSSARRAPKTSGGERRRLSHKEHSPRDRTKSQFAAIPEYTEDRQIIRRLTDLFTIIDQHAENYYSFDSLGNLGDRDLDNPRTRSPAMRRYIAQQIIRAIIEDGSDR